MKKILNCQGQGLTEYLILLILVAVVSMTAVKTLGTTIRGKVNDVKAKMNQDLDVRLRSNEEN